MRAGGSRRRVEATGRGEVNIFHSKGLHFPLSHLKDDKDIRLVSTLQISLPQMPSLVR